MITYRRSPNTERKTPNAERLPVIFRRMSFKAADRTALAKASREEAARLLRASILPRGVDETIKSCIARAAKRLGWPISRTQDIWRLEAARIDAFEMDQLRRLVMSQDSENGGLRSPSKESADN